MILRAAVRPTAETLALAASVRRQARVAVLTNNNLLVKRAADTVFPELRPIFGPNFLFQASFTRGSPNRRPIFVAWRTLALRRKPRFSSMIAPGTWPGRSALGCKHIYIGARRPQPPPRRLLDKRRRNSWTSLHRGRPLPAYRARSRLGHKRLCSCTGGKWQFRARARSLRAGAHSLTGLGVAPARAKVKVTHRATPVRESLRSLCLRGKTIIA